MFVLGVPELIIILVIFGGSQLPKLARSISTSAKELRKGLKDEDGKIVKKTSLDTDKKI